MAVVRSPVVYLLDRLLDDRLCYLLLAFGNSLLHGRNLSLRYDADSSDERFRHLECVSIAILERNKSIPQKKRHQLMCGGLTGVPLKFRIIDFHADNRMGIKDCYAVPVDLIAAFRARVLP